MVIFILQMKKQRYRKGKYLQGHGASRRQSWDFNPSSLAAELIFSFATFVPSGRVVMVAISWGEMPRTSQQKGDLSTGWRMQGWQEPRPGLREATLPLLLFCGGRHPLPTHSCSGPPSIPQGLGSHKEASSWASQLVLSKPSQRTKASFKSQEVEQRALSPFISYLNWPNSQSLPHFRFLGAFR